MQTLENKIALVTGAGAGIGHAICKSLHASGAAIFAVARNKENLQELRNDLCEPIHKFWSIDLSAEQGQQELLQKLEEFGFPHIVVANMHIPSEKKRLMHISKESFTQDISINIDHLFVIMEKTIRFQRREKFGRWIGISSMSAHSGIPGKTKYNVQKKLMESVLMNLAVEEGKYGITANIVAPGFIITPSIEKNFPGELIEKISAENIMKRAGTAQEVAAAVHFFASPGAGYITGITLPVCGGAQLAWNY